MDVPSWIGLGTLLTAAVGLALVGWQLREQRRALRADFGNLYIQRYWEIDDALLLEPKDTERHRRHRHRYLRLFEDEFDVAGLGFLDAQQWRAWHSILDEPKAMALVRDDLRTCDEAGERFQNLRACIAQRDAEGRPHDIASCSGTRGANT